MRGSAGFVRTERVVLYTEDDPLVLASGRTLGPVEVAYETYGTLSPERDNAIFVCHALTGDAHAAGHHGNPERPGWWDNLIGPGKALDTDRFFVVCPNLLGGCQGTTGPLSADPATGRPYGMDFPMLQMADFVTVHRRLLRHLGVDRLHAAVGGSLGGMQVLQWALDAPEEVANAVVIAASSRLTAQNIAFSAVAREAIMRDPDFQGGEYVGTDRAPKLGLAVARMMAHITYLSEEAMSEKFGRRHQADDSGDVPAENRMGLGVDFQVESYLNHQGETFLDRFDALSYLYLTRVMDYFDPFADPDAAGRIAKGGTHFLVLSFDSDWRFDTSHSRRIVRVLEHNRVPVTFREIRSPWGHDSFLLEVPGYHESIRAFLDRNGAGPRPRAAGARVRTASRRYPNGTITGRPDLDIVAGLVPDGSRVLDLGCGQGDLLALLTESRGCTGTGVEIDPEAVLASIGRGVPVVEMDIDTELDEFADASYDVVVMSQTLQATRRPAEVLRQIRRIGDRCIVSVPNFGLWKHRVGLLLNGRMPVSRELPHPWHETPNIHLSTLADLEALFAGLSLTVEQRILLDEQAEPMRSSLAANLRAGAAIYVLRVP
ncbi:MAG TPA: homoserine O-acetyltransferase [Nocardioidaceae bacterium]